MHRIIISLVTLFCLALALAMRAQGAKQPSPNVLQVSYTNKSAAVQFFDCGDYGGYLMQVMVPPGATREIPIVFVGAVSRREIPIYEANDMAPGTLHIRVGTLVATWPERRVLFQFGRPFKSTLHKPAQRGLFFAYKTRLAVASRVCTMVRREINSCWFVPSNTRRRSSPRW